MIELVLVVAAIGFLALLIGNLPSSISSINHSRHLSLARDIASKEVDFLRKETYSGLTATTDPVPFTDPALGELSQPTAVYEVTDCSSEVCTNDEKIKNIKVKISWNEQGDKKTVELATLIAEGGLDQ